MNRKIWIISIKSMNNINVKELDKLLAFVVNTLKFYFKPNKCNHLASKFIKSLNSPQLVVFNPLSHPLF